jgi:hypothetical protein
MDATEQTRTKAGSPEGNAHVSHDAPAVTVQGESSAAVVRRSASRSLAGPVGSRPGDDSLHPAAPGPPRQIKKRSATLSPRPRA